MKTVISITNTRRDLPKLVKQIQKNPETVFKIAVRSEIVAELRSAVPMVPPGEAVRKLIELRRDLSSSVRDKKKITISKNIKEFLYAKERE